MATTNSFIDYHKIVQFLEDQRVDNTQEVITEISNNVRSIISKHKKKNSKKDEIYLSARPLKSVFPNLDLSILPDWLKDNYNEIRVLGENTLIIPDGRKYQCYECKS